MKVTKIISMMIFFVSVIFLFLLFVLPIYSWDFTSVTITTREPVPVMGWEILSGNFFMPNGVKVYVEPLCCSSIIFFIFHTIDSSISNIVLMSSAKKKIKLVFSVISGGIAFIDVILFFATLNLDCFPSDMILVKTDVDVAYGYYVIVFYLITIVFLRTVCIFDISYFKEAPVSSVQVDYQSMNTFSTTKQMEETSKFSAEKVSEDINQKLLDLKKIYDQKLITEEEYHAAKMAILNNEFNK